MKSKRRDEDIDREALAAAAMAFAPATDIPRERALVRSAIISLLLECGDKEFSKEKGIMAISRHGALPELRGNIARTLFDKMIEMKIISSDGTDIFHFDKDFAKNIYEEQDRINQMIDRVISDLFETDTLPPQIIPKFRKVLLASLAHVMKLYGEQYAYQIAGRVDKPVVVQHKELVNICYHNITKDIKGYLSPEKMADAITELFEQKERHFSSFVFYLAQNYYYLRLMGIGGGLEYLIEDRFNGSEFLLDTNILLQLLIEHSRHYRSIMELVSIALKLNISLHESEITLDEFKRVIDYQRIELAKAFDEVPDDLIQITKSILFQDYRKNKQQNSDLTVESYFAQFHDIREKLKQEWGITVFDDPVERSISDKELEQTKRIINECSEKIRNRKKTNESLAHDAHIYYVILAERSRFGENTAWFLTLDTSLPHVARDLQGIEQIPFCMTLDGFLQIISPHVRADNEQSFAEMFVELVGNNLFPPEEVISIEDFRMFTDFDLSVRNLPGADVKKVIRRVKGALHGSISLDTDRKKIAYEVQKALSDPSLKYRTEMEEKFKKKDDEIEELLKGRDRDRDKYDLEVRKIKLDHDIKYEKLNRQVQEMAQKSSDYEKELDAIQKKHKTACYLLKVFLSIFILAILVRGFWWLIDYRKEAINNPELLKISSLVTAIAAWVGIICTKKILSIISFIFSVLGALFTAWKAFVK
jgi:predicted nucleic acid-binding protein